MKTIILSFDDARWDTYDRAAKVLIERGMIATINVITDFVKSPKKYKLSCCESGSMTLEQLKIVKQKGFEIASHSSTHCNDLVDIEYSISELYSMGLISDVPGFASPKSELTMENGHKIIDLVHNGKLAYVRTGIQVKREGFLYSVITYMNRYFHSKYLFWLLNKRNVIQELPELLPSVSITSKHTLKEIIGFIDKMEDGSAVILMLHSVLDVQDAGYGQGLWYWDTDKFRGLCDYLSTNKLVRVITTMDFVKEKKERYVCYKQAGI